VHFEARHYIILALDLLGFLVAQSTLGGLKPLAKIFDIGIILFSLLASFLAGFDLSLQVISAFLGTTQRLWKEKSKTGCRNKIRIYKMQGASKLYL
jgi:hypothetical protein